MRTPNAALFGLSMFWVGLQRGAESPRTTVGDLLVVAVVVIVAAVTWELVARARRSPGDPHRALR